MFGLTGYASLVVTIAAVFVVFVVSREFWCWFFKINDFLANQKKIINHLEMQGARAGDIKDLLSRQLGTKRPEDPPLRGR